MQRRVYGEMRPRGCGAAIRPSLPGIDDSTGRQCRPPGVGGGGRGGGGLCVRDRDRDRERVCVRERERERERACV